MKKIIAVLLVLVMALSLVACSAEETAPAAEAATAGAPAGNTEVQANAARADRDTIVIALQGELTTLDHEFASDDGNMRPITWNIYEPLVRLNATTLEAEPVLATEWTQIDDTTMQFKIREGVTFHDGDKLDAEDVAFSINRCLDPDFNSQMLSSIETIDHAEVVDEYTVNVITKAGDPILITRLTLLPIYSKEFTEPKTDIEMTTVANGTGPYKFVEWKAGDYASITAFDGYWGEAPAIKNAKYRFIEERLTALAALQAGEVDLAVNMYPEYSEDLPQVISQISNECYWIRFNQVTDGAIFADVNLRLAAAHAIDTTAIAEALFQGYATPMKGSMLREGYTGYTELPGYEYDLEQAKELMEKAGYAGQEIQFVSERGRWLKDGEVTEAVAAQLTTAGFNVVTQFLSWNEWLDMLFDKERVPDLFFSSNGNDFFDADRPLYICGSSLGNQSAVPATEWDDKIVAAQSEMDPEARQALYDEINQHFYEEPYALYVLGADALYGGAVDLQWTARRDTNILVCEMSYAG